MVVVSLFVALALILSTRLPSRPLVDAAAQARPD
jgi:hypothetical protein